ncbi:concanavalin A-like lectin/glucanase domain-containing protein [Pseudomassariella vexata]|uniref:Concanavalin A-like lectin/glucanase domain-containing protein n=1 Tax=Pseudomassariella vexata TaxID=1141098 RepID=A0A1Y2E5L2_9PEZI|nr:concanavalin A-like lectin/glucanase domain-containing protein [Pseudomassariella vexata]ORY66566.1 concanavalin A-like lectin/glucanase domain-containing protein [Pseudomassariella vexata]
MKARDACLVAIALILRGASATDLVEPTSKDNSDQCQCYLASGPDPGYFQYHRFWDFRSIPLEEGNTFIEAPELVTDYESEDAKDITSAYFGTTAWQNDWSFLSGPAKTSSSVTNAYSPQNVYISRNTTDDAQGSTYLTLRASRADDFMSTAQITSNQQNLLYASLRTRMRVIPNGLSQSSAPSAGDRPVSNPDTGSSASHPVDEGAVVGFFTYHSDTQESDIEILTGDATDQIRYSNQPDYNAKTDSMVPGASSQLTLPGGKRYTEWIEHRLDWYEGTIRWWADGELVLNKTTNTPTEPSGLIMNLWGDGGFWSGNMSVGGQVLVGVEWVEVVFNVSGGNPEEWSLERRDEDVCKVGCRIDEVKAVGFPEVEYDSGSAAMVAHLAHWLLISTTLSIILS